MVKFLHFISQLFFNKQFIRFDIRNYLRIKYVFIASSIKGIE